MTGKENTRRGQGPGGINARKTHCLRGHELTPDNTRILKDKRYCVKCRAERDRLVREKRAALGAAGSADKAGDE